jgi:hypothetical protein
MSTLFTHVPHHWIAGRKAAGPPQMVADQAQGGVNDRIALAITKIVGSMWCAYAFGLFDLISLPAAIKGGSPTIVSWVAQTFLQLVLLSIIMVGQNVQAAAADKRAEATYLDAEAVLHEALQIQAHLQVQDDILTKLIAAAAAPPVNTAYSGGMGRQPGSSESQGTEHQGPSARC